MRVKAPAGSKLGAKAEANPGKQDVHWNFEKFLVDRSGEPVRRFSPLVEPESEEILDAIESLLAET